MGERVMMLVTSLPGTNEIEKNQTFLRQLFKGRKVPFVELDGADQSKKEERERLFAMSGKRGGYPQVFIEGPSGTSYVGDFVDVVGMADNEDYPPGDPRQKPAGRHLRPILQALPREGQGTPQGSLGK